MKVKILGTDAFVEHNRESVVFYLAAKEGCEMWERLSSGGIRGAAWVAAKCWQSTGIGKKHISKDNGYYTITSDFIVPTGEFRAVVEFKVKSSYLKFKRFEPIHTPEWQRIREIKHRRFS